MKEGQDGDIAARVAALEREVVRLGDLEAIRAAIYTYARGFDRADGALLNEVYHEDAFDNHGNWSGDRAQTLKILMEKATSGVVTNAMHHLGNMLIELNGDTAQVETYFVAYARASEGGRTFTRTRAGRYLDRFAKRDGRWRVVNRQVVDDWNRIDQVVATSPDAEMNAEQARRDRSDASYRHLPGFLAGIAG